MEGSSSSSNNKIRQTQAQVDEVVGVMKMNIAKVLERDHKLSELDDRADALNIGASQFEQQAIKLKRRMWWKNLKKQECRLQTLVDVSIILLSWLKKTSHCQGEKKFTLILGAIVGTFILIMIIWIVNSFSGDGDSIKSSTDAP